MMMLWAIAGVPLGVYNIVSELNIALRVQAQILTFLSLVTWAQCLYYGKVCEFHTIKLKRNGMLTLLPETLNPKVHRCRPLPASLAWGH
jgi:hypothetical protein